MRTNLPYIQTRVAQTVEGRGTKVRISWVIWPTNTTLDTVNGTRLNPDGSDATPTPQMRTVKALLHFPEPRVNSEVRQFNEIEAGDCIADFCEDVQIDGLDKLEFVFLGVDGLPIDSNKWVTKPVSERLAVSWNLVIQGVKLFRCVLLRKAT